MIPLKKKYKKRGGRLTQIYVDDEIGIYRTTFPSVEIFKMRIGKADKFHDDEWEVYPSDEDFGTYAWSCTSIESIRKILQQRFPNHPITKGEITIDFSTAVMP